MDSLRLRSFSAAAPPSPAEEDVAAPVVDDCRRIQGRLPSAMSTKDSRRVAAVVAARDRGPLTVAPNQVIKEGKFGRIESTQNPSRGPGLRRVFRSKPFRSVIITNGGRSRAPSWGPGQKSRRVEEKVGSPWEALLLALSLEPHIKSVI